MEGKKSESSLCSSIIIVMSPSSEALISEGFAKIRQQHSTEHYDKKDDQLSKLKR